VSTNSTTPASQKNWGKSAYLLAAPCRESGSGLLLRPATTRNILKPIRADSPSITPHPDIGQEPNIGHLTFRHKG
ncbi:uncharacterized protein METZ01_LOCUS357225, partial [marine metagenome]